jgi:hypothetical protein
MMKVPSKRILYWTPRILGILFALFVSIFALDVFGAGYSFWETIVALFMHLIPVYLLLIALAIAWRWERFGALLYITLAIWYLVMAWDQGSVVETLMQLWPIALPPIVIGLLFILDWLYQPALRPH